MILSQLAPDVDRGLGVDQLLRYNVVLSFMLGELELFAL